MAAESLQSRLTEGNKRLGGARADFVASLGRKVEGLRKSLSRLREIPGDAALRDEFRRKLRALGSGAKLMKFDGIDREIAEALGLLDRTPNDVTLDEADVDKLEQVLEDLPALAWGDERPRPTSGTRVIAAPAPTYSALVVGAPLIAEALLEKNKDKPTFACNCMPDAQAAFDLARTMEPDLIVIDADLQYTTELVDALMDDAVMETVPVVVIGSFTEQGEAARFIAMGVTKTLAKPTSRDRLRKACEEALDPPYVTNLPASLGEPTLEELGERLALELHTALVGNMDGATKKLRVPLGEGTEVLSALWGTIARVREVVTARTNGVVRYAGCAPEGALAFAPSLHHDELARADRARGRARGLAAEVNLSGRKVVVADDDPAVVWFLADLLKSAGCIVHEAFDGMQALEAIYRVTPDVVISDIVMPKLDGFSLCRALRHDVALRDVPVILLSWKEDLLQRVRELGAGAAGYVRKESDTRAIVARVREALRPRTRIEARLRERGEVRGRLDGVSVRTLLEITSATRPDARVSVRDASFLYEIEIRDGAPVRAMRTNGEGSVLQGRRVLAALLGVGAGRFTVTTSTSAIDGDLQGTLASQLAAPVARARAATALLAAPGLRFVENSFGAAGGALRVRLDREALADYLRATPFGLRDLALSIAEGTSPRALVASGACDATLAEDLACDLASRGLVVGIEDEGGQDLLGPATAKIVEYMDACGDFASYTQMSSLFIASPACVRDGLIEPFANAYARGESAFAPCPPDSASSLEDAVMREIIHRSPEPPAAAPPDSKPALLEPSVLKHRLALPRSDGDDDASWVDTLSHDSLAPTEPTVIDDTMFTEHDTSIPIEVSQSVPQENLTTDAHANGDIDATVPMPALVKKRRLWPAIVFAMAITLIVFAYLHFAGIAIAGIAL
ncbi:MAG: response regulator [Polyangiaceae bacterium]|nr:response regulator [Polyangiaceae bacterium]